MRILKIGNKRVINFIKYFLSCSFYQCSQSSIQNKFYRKAKLENEEQYK